MQFIDLKTQYQKLEAEINQRITQVLTHGSYIMGPEVSELENALSQAIKVKHSIALSSGTDALLVAMMALDVGPGDEIITSPFSFFATVETIVILGAKPVFVDIDPDTYNLNPALLEAAITAKTKAIIPVSLYGQCADLDAINQIAKQHKLAVIEDGAQSFGAKYKDKYSCAATTIGCTSFFPSKPLGGYGDSGACFTNDDALAEKMRMIRVHGQDRRYHHPIIGINGRMDSLQAAILLAKLTIFNKEIELREQVAQRYHQVLHNIVKTPTVAPFNQSVWAQYTVEVSQRDRIQAILQEQGIPTAVHYPIPLHLQPACSNLGLGVNSYPIAEKVAAKVMSLPMHPYLMLEDQQRIAKILQAAIESL